jgi:hypothetical protein
MSHYHRPWLLKPYMEEVKGRPKDYPKSKKPRLTQPGLDDRYAVDKGPYGVLPRSLRSLDGVPPCSFFA